MRSLASLLGKRVKYSVLLIGCLDWIRGEAVRVQDEDFAVGVVVVNMDEGLDTSYQ